MTPIKYGIFSLSSSEIKLADEIILDKQARRKGLVQSKDLSVGDVEMVLTKLPGRVMKEPPAEWPTEGCIEFKGVTMCYREGPLVLKNVSFTIASMEKVGFCGRTGYVDF